MASWGGGTTKVQFSESCSCSFRTLGETRLSSPNSLGPSPFGQLGRRIDLVLVGSTGKNSADSAWFAESIQRTTKLQPRSPSCLGRLSNFGTLSSSWQVELQVRWWKQCIWRSETHFMTLSYEFLILSVFFFWFSFVVKNLKLILNS